MNAISKRSRSRDLTYHNGVTIGVMRRIGQFWFEKNYVDIRADREKWKFVITVKSDTPAWTVKKFISFWEIDIVVEVKMQ